MLQPLPTHIRSRVDLFRNPAPAKDASTIAVVRDGAQGIEAFLMRRQPSMAFAAGMYVFPGGGVDEADQTDLPWAGPAASYFAERFRCAEATARSLVIAAARETFEETGVLLAGEDERSVVADTSQFHYAREQLERHELTFSEFLTAHNLVLRADLLGAWSHWITPVFEPRRYDTRFFVAALPDGQRIDSVSDEADSSFWVPVSDMLEAHSRGEAAMMIPTVATCQELAHESADSVLASSETRVIRPIEMKVIEKDGELWADDEL